MKECLCFATALVVTLTQAHGFSESETTLGYKAGYEWQNSDTQLLDLTLTGLAGDRFAIEALTLYDQLGDQTASGLGIPYRVLLYPEGFLVLLTSCRSIRATFWSLVPAVTTTFSTGIT